MRVFRALLFLMICGASIVAQNEQAPILEKGITYKDWTYKDIRTDSEVNLRQIIAGKKLVIIVYYAPWCPNWRFDAPMLIRLYNKYRVQGLEIVAVGGYDPLPSLKNNLDFLKVPFPAVYESASREDREKTKHHDYRRSTGDERKWGSPWYIFLETVKMEKKGDVLVRKTHIINGEMIETEGEKFIREKLGLSPIAAKTSVNKKGEIEVCEPDRKIGVLIKP